ncbi:tRNA preQ1(34) S-adenosylmethionine ribosyltransferase-isomerase QueA, partial [Patescibacteria group bacterium]
MNTKLFDYNLPKELIAQKPANPRDSSQLLIYDSVHNKVTHDKFYNLLKYLQSGDVLVFNNSKVFPARLILQKQTGGKIEVFLLQNLGNGKWECLVGGQIKENQKLYFVGTGHCPVQPICKIIKKLDNSNWIVKFNLLEKKFQDWLEKYGQTPLPPYINRRNASERVLKKDRFNYQTVYAKQQGSVAAPTAGLHFTKKLLKQLNKFGVQQEFVTLHVGLGTFQPVKTKKVEEHQMHAEFAMLDKATCQRLNMAKQDGKRIIAVGTTSARILEAATNKQGKLKPVNDWINIFIYPGYKFKFINGLLTNFHLPQSSLLMLVSAM